MIDTLKEMASQLKAKSIGHLNYEGMATVKKIFSQEDQRYLLGCNLLEGTISSKNKIALFADNKKKKANVTLLSLRSFKEKVNIIKKGEFGILIKLERRIDVVPEEGDLLYFFNN
jgi:translation initiation factor IF-2